MLTLLFNGVGFLGPLIPAITSLVFQSLFKDFSLAAAIGMTVGGIITFFLGEYLNKRPPNHAEDFKLKDVSIFRFPHTFLSISMENIGLIALFVAAGMIKENSNLDNISNPYYLIAGIIIVVIYSKIIKSSRRLEEEERAKENAL